MQDTRRKRIVINLDSRPSVATTSRGGKRRWPKVLAVLAFIVVAVVVLAAAGGFFWWQRYKTSPAYSLAVLADAVQRNDRATVDQMLDTDKIVTSLAVQVTEKATSRYGVGLSSPEHQRLAALIPSLMPRVKGNLRDELGKRVQEIAEKSERRPFFVLALTLPYLLSITTEGETARVAVPNRQTELTLTRNADRWNVVAMKDDAMIESIVDRLTEELPAIGQPPRGEMKMPAARARRRRR